MMVADSSLSPDWLIPLVAAQDALARLEAAVMMSTASVRDGLLVRLAYREAAGWLAHYGNWVHPVDLAFRDAGLTGSYAAADLGMRLPSVLPATMRGIGVATPPEDRDVAAALGHARLWRRLAELRSWSPDGLPDSAGIDGLPALLAAARVVCGGARQEGLTATAVRAAAWIWRERGGTGWPGLVFWSAPVQQLHRLTLMPQAGLLAGVLDAVAEAALLARRELSWLQAAEIQASGIAMTARSRLPAVVAVALRRPALTARMLANELGISHRAALDAIYRLVEAGVLREATGRAAWRGFVIAAGTR